MKTIVCSPKLACLGANGFVCTVDDPCIGGLLFTDEQVAARSLTFGDPPCGVSDPFSKAWCESNKVFQEFIGPDTTGCHVGADAAWTCVRCRICAGDKIVKLLFGSWNSWHPKIMNFGGYEVVPFRRVTEEKTGNITLVGLPENLRDDVGSCWCRKCSGVYYGKPVSPFRRLIPGTGKAFCGLVARSLQVRFVEKCISLSGQSRYYPGKSVRFSV